MIDHMVDTEGFEIQEVQIMDPEKNLFRSVYNDFDFGSTVQAALTMQKTVKEETKTHICILIISQSPDTPIITVTELMTTMFMNFITGNAIVCMYPAFTFRGTGLMNYDGPVMPKSMGVTEIYQKAGFLLKTETRHKKKCGFHHLCPNTIRHYTDGQCHMTNIINPFATSTAETSKPLVFWRLRCGEVMASSPSSSRTLSPVKLFETEARDMGTRTLTSYGFVSIAKINNKERATEDSEAHIKEVDEIATQQKHDPSESQIVTSVKHKADIGQRILQGGMSEDSCRRLSDTVFELLRTKLECYHLDRDKLLSKMEEHNVYISGSFPLSLTHANVKSNDLDLYVCREGAAGMVGYLQEEGYKPQSELGEDTDIGRTIYDGVVKDLNLEHESGGRVNVVVTEGLPLQVLPMFHSTIVMNYIAHHGLVMLYPKSTLNNIGTINCGGKIPANVKKVIEKYKGRGFTLTRDYPSLKLTRHRCAVDPYCPQTIRHLQDKEVLHVPFPLYAEDDLGKLRREMDAKKLVWQLANGPFCKRETADKDGFSLGNTHAVGEYWKVHF
ncbi:hypothetical protein MD484_g8057, partial [Candolleomyces efflorescens]